MFAYNLNIRLVFSTEVLFVEKKIDMAKYHSYLDY